MSKTSGSLCGPTSTLYYPALQQFSKTIYIFACVINLVTSVLSVLGNIVILSALRKCQTLHSPSKALLCSLALTDLVVGLVVLPLFITYYLTIILEMPTYYCAIGVSYGRTSSFVAAASLFTIVTIAIDRLLAFHFRLRYKEVVTFKRVVSILISEWIFATLWAGSWFLSTRVNIICGAIGLFICCLVTLLSYISIQRGLRQHVAQIHQQANGPEPANFNVLRYRRTVANMLWIYGVFLVCYIPFLLSLVAILVAGLTSSTRFAVQLSATAVFFNSSLNPFLYCWRINELKEKVFAKLSALSNFFHHV